MDITIRFDYEKKRAEAVDEGSAICVRKLYKHVLVRRKVITITKN